MRFTAETRGYLKCKISPRLTWRGGRNYGRVRTIFSGPKFLGCTDNQVFLPTVLRYYSQIGGVAMGSRLRPNYVCLFMAVTSRNKSLISRQDEHPICTSGISTTLPEPSLVVDKSSKILLPLRMVFLPVWSLLVPSLMSSYLFTTSFWSQQLIVSLQGYITMQLTLILTLIMPPCTPLFVRKLSPTVSFSAYGASAVTRQILKITAKKCFFPDAVATRNGLLVKPAIELWPLPCNAHFRATREPGTIPLVLTHHPTNGLVKKIITRNLHLVRVTVKQQQSFSRHLRDSLVRSALDNTTAISIWTSLWRFSNTRKR